MPSERAAVAVATIILEKKRRSEAARFSEICDLVKNLSGKFDLGALRIYRSGQHYFSEEISEIVADYLMLGLAEQSSPIVLTAKGDRILNKILSEESDHDFVERMRSAVQESLEQAS